MFRKYRIKLLSRLRTPLQSDTIFGHLCWGIKYLFGEEKLISFLKYMAKEPLIKISCGFPKDCLPMPVLPPMSKTQLRNIAYQIGKTKADNEQQALFIGLVEIKSVRKRSFISIDIWQRLRKELDEYSLTVALINEPKKDRDNLLYQSIHPHTTISRNEGIVMEEGGLYFEREWWAPPEAEFDLYVWFKDQEVKSLWDKIWKDYIEATGFGKDKSTGAGHIKISEDNSFDTSLFHLDNANSWMSISLLGFERLPLSNALYKPTLKFGKLGGDYAVYSPTGGKVNPFKKPLIMLEPGAVFQTETPPKGSLLKEVHQDKNICHYGYGLFVPFYLNLSYKMEN